MVRSLDVMELLIESNWLATTMMGGAYSNRTAPLHKKRMRFKKIENVFGCTGLWRIAVSISTSLTAGESATPWFLDK